MVPEVAPLHGHGAGCESDRALALSEPSPQLCSEAADAIPIVIVGEE